MPEKSKKEKIAALHHREKIFSQIKYKFDQGFKTKSGQIRTVTQETKPVESELSENFGYIAADLRKILALAAVGFLIQFILYLTL